MVWMGGIETRLTYFLLFGYFDTFSFGGGCSVVMTPAFHAGNPGMANFIKVENSCLRLNSPFKYGKTSVAVVNILD